MEINKWRMIYLLEHSIDYIKENGMFLDFTDEWSITWSREELDYFEIDNDTVKELDEYGYIESEE